MLTYDEFSIRADVTLTDLENCLPLLKKNAKLNQEHLGRQTIEARQLCWGAEQDLKLLISERGPFDLVLVSDCVYYQDSLEPLVETLVKVGATVLLSYEERYSEEKVKVQKRFFELIEKAGFEAQEYPTSECHPEYASPDIHVLRLDQRSI